MPKAINLTNPRQAQLEGIKKVVDTMKITIGPRGKNVSLTNGDIVNDGKRIAEDVVLKDPQENKGATKVRNLVRRISSDVGGGRTACAILYKELCQTGVNLLERGFNANLLKKGMDLAVKDITEQLDKMAQLVKGRLKEIATISTESEELGKIIADTIDKVGLDSVIKVETGSSFGVVAEHEDGLHFDKGWISPWFITNKEKLEAEYTNIPVLLADYKISSFKDLLPYFEACDKKKKLLVICDDLDAEALNISIMARAQQGFGILAIKTPGLGDNKKYCLEDLAALTGAEILTENATIPVKLGNAKSILSKQNSSVITGTGDIKTWITTLRTRASMTENKWEIDQFNERIAKLSNGIAVIKVGASSEDEVKYLKLKIEDGVNETKRALEEGIVMGGNVAFIHARGKLAVSIENSDIASGYKIVFDALLAPLKQIVENSGGSPDVVINILKEARHLTQGYNSLDNTMVEDMYKLGIIDAVKVVKAVLQYAVSEASIFLSIGGDISEELIETK